MIKVIPEATACVIPEGCSRESQSYKTTQRRRLPTETLGNDGVSEKRLRSPTETLGDDDGGAKRPGLPTPAGRQTLGNDGGGIKQTYAAGFTLIELLVVVLIIGILAAVALPHYEVAVMKSKLSAMLPLMRSIKDAEERYYLANGVYSNNITDLDVQPPAGNSLSNLPAGFVFYDNGTYLDAVGLVDREDWYVMGGLKKDWSGGGCLLYMYFDHHKEYPGQIRCHGAGTAYAKCEQACKSLGYAYY